MPLNDIPDNYKKYDDNQVLLIDKNYIPTDYDKPFAITPRPILNGVLEKGYKIVLQKKYVPYINNQEKFARVLIQKSLSQRKG